MWLRLYSGIAGLAYLPATQPHLRAASFTPLNRAALFFPRLVSLCGERGQGVRLVALAIFNLRGRAFPGRPKEKNRPLESGLSLLGSYKCPWAGRGRACDDETVAQFG